MPNNNVRGNSSHISSTSNQSAATSIQAQRVVTPEEVNGPNNSSMGAHDSSSQADQETLHEVVENEQDVSQELNNLFNPQANSTYSEEGVSSNLEQSPDPPAQRYAARKAKHLISKVANILLRSVQSDDCDDEDLGL